MRPYRWTAVILLLSLVLGVSPAAAVVRPIDPAQPPAPVLERAEREKLAALLQWTQPVLISEVSPDDRSDLIAHRDAVGDHRLTGSITKLATAAQHVVGLLNSGPVPP